MATAPTPTEAPIAPDIAALRLDVAPTLAGTRVNDAADLFLLPAYAKLLCLCLCLCLCRPAIAG